MPKATINDVTDEGFVPASFGTPGDWGTAGTGYVARILSSAQRWVTAQLGGSALYDGVAGGTYAEECIIKAELEWAKAMLWRRRAAFTDSAANLSLNENAHLNRREFNAHADAAEQLARYYIDELGRALGLSLAANNLGTGASMGVVESGRYPMALAL